MQSIPIPLIATALVVVMAGHAEAQTARPDDQTTAGALAARIADTIVNVDDIHGLEAILRSDVVVRRSGQTGRDSVAHLRSVAVGRTIIAARTYVGTPAALATDLCTDFRDAEIPDIIRRAMIPAAEADLNHANQVAVNWINAAVSPSSTDVVGVIVLSPANGSADVSKDHAAQSSAPLFIVVKATLNAQGRAVPRLIVFGDPRQ